MRKDKTGLLDQSEAEKKLKTLKPSGRPISKPKRVSYNTRLDKSIKKRILHAAIDKETTAADIINTALSEWLDKNEQ